MRGGYRQFKFGILFRCLPMRFLMSQIVFRQRVLSYVRQNVDVGLLFLYSIIRYTNYVCVVRMVLCENSMGIFIHMTCLDQSPASENN